MDRVVVSVAFSIFLVLSQFSIGSVNAFSPHKAAHLLTKESLKRMTPEDALQRLIIGNRRYVNNQPIKRDLLRQAKVTSIKGQFPYAVILSCMDSRGSLELIFDQGIGKIFSVRVAGNVIDQDQLGSIEYAVKGVGSKLIVVMGHTQCGAVKAACSHVTLGNLTMLLKKINPAVQIINHQSKGKMNCKDADLINRIAKVNVLVMMQKIKNQSVIIRSLLQHKRIGLVGAMHDLFTGQVMFFDEQGKKIKM